MSHTLSYTITEETLSSLESYWQKSSDHLKWEPVFVLPPWLKVWRQSFAPEAKLYLPAVRENGGLIGIAPLMIDGDTASIIGSPNVCDYLDFITPPGKAADFFTALIENLKQKGITRLNLDPVRPDSAAMTRLVKIAGEKSSCQVAYQQDDVTLELELPATWEEYLEMLSVTQRHEIRRKLRKLEKAGEVSYRVIGETQSIPDVMDTFLKFFIESKKEKSEFMTDKMRGFFISLAGAMGEAGILRFGVLELDTLPVAMVMCFDYNNNVYLYNSGYDPRYNYLSVGLLSKVLYIKDCIEKHRRKFDFLKGDEAYKYQLGGKEVPIYSCQIAL
ncbi:MAG: GNAT family N-acetyltransferase [Chloroflexi bacterium]|nr:GNAT family N-acetyltransferase [Chloroflexota bacterium]